MKEIRITANVLENEFRYLARLLNMEKYKTRDINTPYLKMEVSSTGSKKYRLMVSYLNDKKEDRIFSTAESMSLREMHYHIVGLVEGVKQGRRLEQKFLERKIMELGIEILPEDRQESLKKAVDYLTKQVSIHF